MIPKVMPSTKSFGGRVAYVQKSGDAVCETRNLADISTAATEMAATASLSRRCELPSYHFILSFAALEHPDDNQLIAAADRCLDQLGMAEHQAVLAIHRDRDHQHIHIVVNRVHPVTHRAASLSHDYAKLEKACREIEHQQGWSADRGRFQAEVVTRADGGEEVQLVAARRNPTPRPTQAELALERRTGRRSLAATLGADRDEIAAAIGDARSWTEMNQRLAPLGVQYEAKGTGAVLRSTVDPEDVIKPSSVDRAWSRAKLEKRFGPMQPADQAGISKGKIDGPDHKPNIARIGTAPPPRARNRLLPLSACPVARVTRGHSVLLPGHVPGHLVDGGAERTDRLRRPEPGPGLTAKSSPRERLWQQFQVERQAGGERRAAEQAEWEAQRGRETARRAELIQRQRAGRDWVYRLLPRGIVRGIFLWFQKQAHLGDLAMLRAEQAAARDALRERRKAAPGPPRNWRDWLEQKAKEGDQEATSALQAMKFRDEPSRKKAAAASRPDPERELVAMRQLRLVDVAGRYGYVLAPGSKPEHASVRMKNAAGDVIVVKQDRVRGDRYFRTDGAASGNVLELVQFEIQGTLADVRQALRPLIGELPPAPNGAGRRPLADPPAADHTAARQAWMTARPGLIGFLQNRGILNATIARFQSEIRVDSRGNALFAHRDAAGNLVGFEMKNHDFAGFAKGGQKTIAVFGPAFAKRIVVTESGLDALSIAQIEGRDDTRYVSLGGAPGRRAFDELRRLAAGADQVVIGVDNDAAGGAIAERIRAALADVPDLAVTDGRPPVGKDWNDTLRAALAAATRTQAAQDLAAIDASVRRPPAKGRGGEGIGG